MDYQMNTLEQIVLKEKNRITSATVPLYETTEVIYEAIDKRINELVEATTYNCKYVILVGAILINSDTDIGSFSATKRFDVIELATGKRIDYLNKYLL